MGRPGAAGVNAADPPLRLARGLPRLCWPSCPRHFQILRVHQPGPAPFLFPPDLPAHLTAVRTTPATYEVKGKLTWYDLHKESEREVPVSSSCYSGSSGHMGAGWGLSRFASLRVRSRRTRAAFASSTPTHSAGSSHAGSKPRDETMKRGSKEERERPVLFRQLQDNETL